MDGQHTKLINLRLFENKILESGFVQTAEVEMFFDVVKELVKILL